MWHHRFQPGGCQWSLLHRVRCKYDIHDAGRWPGLVCVGGIVRAGCVAGETGRVGEEEPWGVWNAVDEGSPSEMMYGLFGRADTVEKGLADCSFARPNDGQHR
jgi:hypothetical protein